MKTHFQLQLLVMAISSILLNGCGGTSSSTSNDVATPVVTGPSTPSTPTTPVANAGMDIQVNVGETATLTASSNAQTGDSVSYLWTLENKPDTSNAAIQQATAQQATLAVDSPGAYEIGLQVTINGTQSEKDFVIITASSDSMDITNRIFENRSNDCRNYIGQFYASATDIKRNAAFVGDVEIIENTTYCVFNSNAIPNHDFNDQSAAFATNVSEQSMTFKVAVQPSMAASSTSLSLGTTEAILLNGVTVDLLAAACYGVGNEPLGEEKIGCGPNQNANPWRYDPMSSLNQFGTDEHHAHVQPSGEYHYHGNPMALYNQDCNGKESGVIGFAADGFPLFGSCIIDPQSGDIRKVVSSYALKDNGGIRQSVSGYQTPVAGQGSIASNRYDGQFRGDWAYQAGLGDLDECNGMTRNGVYGYYVTDQYPWVLNCFKGTIDTSFSATPQLARRSHSHEEANVHTHENGETHSH